MKKIFNYSLLFSVLVFSSVSSLNAEMIEGDAMSIEKNGQEVDFESAGIDGKTGKEVRISTESILEHLGIESLLDLQPGDRIVFEVKDENQKAWLEKRLEVKVFDGGEGDKITVINDTVARTEKPKVETIVAVETADTDSSDSEASIQNKEKLVHHILRNKKTYVQENINVVTNNRMPSVEEE